MFETVMWLSFSQSECIISEYSVAGTKSTLKFVLDVSSMLAIPIFTTQRSIFMSSVYYKLIGTSLRREDVGTPCILSRETCYYLHVLPIGFWDKSIPLPVRVF